MESIVTWIRDFINEFRTRCQELSEVEKAKISNLDDFFPPSQILLLWFQSANLQYIICTHDNKRDDMEIEIKGPIPTYETVGLLDSILKDPKWGRELSPKEKEHVYDKTVTFSQILESTFLQIVNEIQNRTFEKPSPTSGNRGKRILISRDFLWRIEGNVTEVDKIKIITEIMDQAKKDAVSKAQPTAELPPKPSMNSCATYFYPPVWIGKRPQKTFKEKTLRSFFVFPQKALDLEYKGKVVVVNQDGLIAIGEQNVSKATRMLNEIMATFLLMGFEATAVRELEVCEATIDPASLTVTSWGTRTYTLRTQSSFLFDFIQQPFWETRSEIAKEDIVKVIRQAQSITEDPDIADFLIFFLEAHTHLQNSEFSQSFIMSWVIIERQMHWLWKNFLKEEQMPRRRRQKLSNPAYWTIDFVLEGLNLGGRLSQVEYQDLITLKDKRNDIIHQGEATSLEEAERCFRLAKDIVKKRSGLYQKPD